MANGHRKESCLKLLANIKCEIKKEYKQKFEKQPRLHKERYLHRKFQGIGLNMFWSTYESFLPPCLIKGRTERKSSIN